LVIYGNTPPPQFKPVLDAFAKAYPSIKVSYSAQEDNVGFSKYRAEHAQGARTADIIIASSPLQWNNNRDIALSCWTPNDVAAYPSFLKQFPGVFILSPDPAVSVYSKAKLPANRVPTSFAQLESYVKRYPGLFNKKIATYSVSNQFGYSAFWGLGQERGGWSVMNVLAPASKPQADGTAIIQQLASGASNYAFFESGLVRTAFTGALGKIIGWTYMRDFTPLIPRGVAITKGAGNPTAAKTFLDWAYSSTGQQVLCTAGFTAFRSGVTCPNSLASIDQAVGSANVFLVPFHSTIAQDQTVFVKRWHQVFG
jgi:iron(III) transport system substrate-binding protein